MKRKAFLIASPQEETSKEYLPGVTPDIINMKAILKSLKGGAWDDSEIEVLKNPTRSEILSKIKGSYDYVIIQYSGHGFEYSNQGTQLYLSKTESIGLDEINKNFTSPKKFYFIDCCRHVEYTIEKAVESSLIENIIEFSNNKRRIIRNRYERIINSCEDGISIIYSCSKNESADEDENGLGGIFTLSFIRIANSLIPDENQYYDIKAIFDSAVVKMKKDYGLSSQNPRINSQRRLRYFPLIINTEVHNV